MPDPAEVVSSLFEENLLTLYTYGRKVLLLHRADTGDQSQPIPPENFYDVPADLRVEWITLAGGIGIQLTSLVGQIGAEMQKRQGPGGG